MTSTVDVTIHESQFPENVRKDFVLSLLTRAVNHKFHYDSFKQTQKWLAVHEAYSPSRSDLDCAAIYEAGFRSAAARCEQVSKVHLIGLGCGGGKKDSQALRLLARPGRALVYVPCDVSSAMVLVACQTAGELVGKDQCRPLVCDLMGVTGLGELLDQMAGGESTRIITFFGMIPNFEPQMILPLLTKAVRPGDLLLFSANLSPGADYLAGIQQVLPLYQNALTEDWLITFLLDLGVNRADGAFRWRTEEHPQGSGCTRIVACFEFRQDVGISFEEGLFDFKAGESIRLFFSYRYQPGQIRGLLEQSGLNVIDSFVTRSEEEGVFLCQRNHPKKFEVLQ